MCARARTGRARSRTHTVKQRLITKLCSRSVTATTFSSSEIIPQRPDGDNHHIVVLARVSLHRLPLTFSSQTISPAVIQNLQVACDWEMENGKFTERHSVSLSPRFWPDGPFCSDGMGDSLAHAHSMAQRHYAPSYPPGDKIFTS